MPDQAKPVRFGLLFSWGGVVLALLGLALGLTGSWPVGLLLMAAGVVFWLFAKRRSRGGA
jgi:hypothetical protein